MCKLDIERFNRLLIDQVARVQMYMCPCVGGSGRCGVIQICLCEIIHS